MPGAFWMCCVVPALVSCWVFPKLHSLYRPYGQAEGGSLAQILQESKNLQVFTVRVYRYLL